MLGGKSHASSYPVRSGPCAACPRGWCRIDDTPPLGKMITETRREHAVNETGALRFPCPVRAGSRARSPAARAVRWPGAGGVDGG
ncbi:hypothetical protein SXCC_03042 [Gluconacetobacter sp. SXCC-1]|nr:hypothetical protein SXCC_03042 [Gluconacetobacter sp. SXCC-1]